MSPTYPSRYCREHRFCGRRGAFRLYIDGHRQQWEARRKAVDAVSRRKAWRDQVAVRGRGVVGRSTWREFLDLPADQVCRTLAAAAKQAEKADALSKEEFASLVLRGDGESAGVAHRVAAAIGGAVLGHVGDLRQVALSLRVLGVFVCACAERVDRCVCWRTMVRRHGLEAAEEKLKQGLPEQLSA